MHDMIMSGGRDLQDKYLLSPDFQGESAGTRVPGTWVLSNTRVPGTWVFPSNRGPKYLSMNECYSYP